MRVWRKGNNMKLHGIKQFFCSSLLLVCMTQAMASKTVTWCIYDAAGHSGSVMQIMKDYSLFAKKWGVHHTLKVFSNEEKALAEFKNKQCDGIAASSFLTREYNHFLGTTGAIGLIPDNQTAHQVFAALGEPSLSKHMVQNGYEAVGWIPIGSAYFMVKDRNINSITHLAGLRIAILREDPSHERMARRVGATPVFVTFSNAASKLIKGEVDVLPAPIYAYRPFELQRGIGIYGGVINFPMSYMSLNLIVRQEAIPKNYGQHSRNWFMALTPRMMQNVFRWEQSMPKKYWYDIPTSERQSYQRLLTQLRREFIGTRVYNHDFIKLVLEKQCDIDAQYFECKK